jgi:hypothetical protein
MKRWLRIVAVLVIVSGALWFGRLLAQEATTDLQAFIANIRIDMEILADRVYGGTRPDGWTGNIDLNAPNLIADLWFDNELLANTVFGEGVRPSEWIGATTPNALLVTRNIRHDLELSAQTFLNGDIRPSDWNGAAAIYRCDRTLQNLVYLLATIYGTPINTREGTLDYCRSVVAELQTTIRDLPIEQISTDELPSLVLAVRGDLERLADERLGVGTRPEPWLNNKDVNSPTLAEDINMDLERLADELVPAGERPRGWEFVSTDNAVEVYRILRRNLELLADETLAAGVRPRGWQGTDQLQRCDNLTQTLVVIVQQQYQFTIPPELDPNSATFCADVTRAANDITENPPSPDEVVQEAEDTRYLGESQYAFAYLDVAATQYMGVMPGGTQFKAWYRNFNESNMMFVSGDDFALFIDRRWTTVDDRTFSTLPTLEGVRPLTFCNATWCNGPSPTPTPTGSGPLIEILTGATPPPSLSDDGSPVEGKTLVNWNSVRVTYIIANTGRGTAQVALELCADPSQVVCEPVLSVISTSTGLALPVISVANGLNVYELPFGYNPNVIIESAIYVSNDVWLNDPTLSAVPTSTPVATAVGP